MKIAVSLRGEDLASSLARLSSQALSILSKYQLRSPAEREHKDIPGNCRVRPFLCIWQADVSALDGLLHWDEMNRVILRVMSTDELPSAIERISEARKRIAPYESQDEGTLLSFLGAPVSTDEPQARMAALFSLAGWGGLAIANHTEPDGFRRLNQDCIPLVESLVQDPPSFVETEDQDEWFTHYSGWSDSESSDIAERICLRRGERLKAYDASPRDIVEHANIERATAQGGYGRRQLDELVQNGADEMIHYPGGIIHAHVDRGLIRTAQIEVLR